VTPRTRQRRCNSRPRAVYRCQTGARPGAGRRPEDSIDSNRAGGVVGDVIGLTATLLAVIALLLVAALL